MGRNTKNSHQSFNWLQSKISLSLVVLLIGFGLGYSSNTLTETPQAPIPLENTVSVCFSPDKRCQLKIIHEIDSASKSIHVQAYSFTDQDIAQSLVNASKRGVLVKVILDKSNIKDGRSAKDAIIASNIPLRYDHPSGIAHNKIIIIDQNRLLTGSYNFSKAAYTRNTENLLTIHNTKLAEEYTRNWESRWNISAP